MKKSLLLIILFIGSNLLFAQKNGKGLIDSLLIELNKTKKDTSVVNIFNDLSRVYDGIDINLQIKYADSALVLSKRIDWKKGILSSIKSIGNVKFSQGEFLPAIKIYDSCLKLNAKVQNQYEEASLYNNIANCYTSLGQFSDALLNYKISISKNDSIGNELGAAKASTNMASIYLYQKDYINAETKYISALSIFKRLKYDKGISSILGSLGVLYSSQGKNSQAIEVYFDALKICETNGDRVGVAMNYDYIGGAFLDIGFTKKAIDYYNKALQISIELKDKVLQANYLAHLADANSDNYNQSLFYNEESLKIQEQIGNINNTGVQLGRLGGDFLNIGRNDTAISILKKCLTMISVEEDKSQVYCNLAFAYINKGMYDIAIKFSKLGLTNATENENLVQIKHANEYLSDSYAHLGRYELAYHHYVDFIKVKDSIQKQTNEKAVLQKQFQYDFDKKEIASKAQHEKQLAITKASNKAKLRVWATIGSAILLLSFIRFYFYRKREADKFKLQLSELKQEALNAQMNDHFIGNTMDSINGFIQNNDKQKASEYLITFSRLIRKVLENATQKMIPLHDDLEILKDYIELEKLRFKDYALVYKINIDDTIDIYNTLIPPMIFQVLTENAIKHGFTKSVGGIVSLNITRNNNVIECSVEDNGIGRMASQKEQEPNSANRISFGTSLAEKLIQSFDRFGKSTTYTVVDLFDVNHNPIGTSVQFSLPLIQVD